MYWKEFPRMYYTSSKSRSSCCLYVSRLLGRTTRIKEKIWIQVVIWKIKSAQFMIVNIYLVLLMLPVSWTAWIIQKQNHSQLVTIITAQSVSKNIGKLYMKSGVPSLYQIDFLYFKKLNTTCFCYLWFFKVIATHTHSLRMFNGMW